MSVVMSLQSYITNRQIKKVLWPRELSSYTVRLLPSVWKQNEILLGKDIDKIFASEWVNSRQVVCGTKCNRLFVLDVVSGMKWFIPMLKGSPKHNSVPGSNCGIHGIAVNLSQTLLATGGSNPNNLAIYRLPTLDPLCIGEFHKDWVFSVVWMSDACVITGSRDGCIALWDIENLPSSKGFNYPVIKPRHSFVGNLKNDKVRDLVYNATNRQIAALSPNSLLHLWDVVTGKMLSSGRLPFTDTVCLSGDEDGSLYAVGSQSHVSFFDSRNAQRVTTICSTDKSAGVRSLSFREHLVTIGTGFGSIFFFDVRMSSYLTLKENPEILCCFKTGNGWLRNDEISQEFFNQDLTSAFPNAAYTHCYDPSGLKLFVGGGPLALGLYGNYAGLWE